jgi:hypothetical protein
MPAFLMADAYFRNPAGDLRLMNGKCAMRLRESFGLTGLRLDLDQYKTADIGVHMSFDKGNVPSTSSSTRVVTGARKTTHF